MEASLIQYRQHLDTFLPAPLIDDLLNHHIRLSYPKDALIFAQGAPADVLFYILNGLVKVYCPVGDGERVLLRLAGPGDFLGNIDFLDSGHHRTQVFEAQAFTRCSLALLTREHLRKSADLLDSKSLVRVLEFLNSAWSSVAHWYAVFLGLSFRERLEAIFRDLATRFGVKDKRGILVLPELSQIDFAEMIQSSRPMVSRLITEMIARKSLERRGRQYIVTERLLAAGNCGRAGASFSVSADHPTMGFASVSARANIVDAGTAAVAMPKTEATSERRAQANAN